MVGTTNLSAGHGSYQSFEMVDLTKPSPGHGSYQSDPSYQELTEGTEADSDLERGLRASATYPHEFTYEKNKKVLRKGPGIFAYWIHVLSLACTAVVLQLSFRQIYWADEDNWGSFATNKWSFGFNQEEVGNILQFPAKLHEIFIVSSLSAIILSVVRRRLIGTRGIPFGFLVGGYQAGSVEYLFSKGFWGPMGFTIRHNKLGAAGLGLCIGLGIVYANVVGPCSAVLIVPNLSWWDVPDPFNGQHLTTYVGATKAELYPQNLTSDMVKLYESQLCSKSNMTALCPGSGNGDLQDYAAAYANEGIAPNITVSQLYGRASRVLSTNRTAVQDNSSILIASTLHSDITEVAGLFWHYVRNNGGTGLIHDIGRPQLQPNDSSNTLSSVVQVQCSHASLRDARAGKANVTFPTSLLTNFTPNVNGTGPLVPPKYWDFDQNYTLTSFSWVDLGGVKSAGQSVSASIGALASVPYYNNKTSVQEKLLVPCIIDARWAATKVTHDPTKDDTLVTNITSGAMFFGSVNDTARRAQYGVGDLVHISTEWADLLNVNGTIGHAEWGVIEVPAIEAIMYQFINNVTGTPTTKTTNSSGTTVPRDFRPPLLPSLDPTDDSDRNSAETIGIVLSMVVADGLSRVSYGLYPYNLTLDDKHGDRLEMVNLFKQAGDESNTGHIAISQDELNEADPVAITFMVQRYGWGYGWHTKTAKFAISVLLLHAAIAMCYVIYGFVHWMLNRWSIHTWEEVGELLALAMLSSEPRPLRGAGAGISKWDTWKLDVMVRVSEKHKNKVELVFGDRYGNPAAYGSGGRVQQNVKYQ